MPKPVPKRGQVLVRVRAATVSTGDWRARAFRMPAGFGPIARLALGLTRPRHPVLGGDLAGDVESAGPGVTAFRPGDRVFASTGTSLGCHAEYRCLSERGTIARIPASLSYEQAAAIPFGGVTALSFLQRKAGVQPGESVLVNGASGAVGSAAVQIARHLGAEVTAVCSTRNLALVQSLGAHHAVDYTQADFTANGQRYDVIMDCAGTAPFARCGRSLRAGGRLLLVLATLPEMLRAPAQARRSNVRVIFGLPGQRAEDLRYLASLAESGAFKPVISRVYPLERVVDAHRDVETGHKVGNVVLAL
jgi:NADPH:quinone reductase-like Zn-dependent oxidoreductase